MDNYRHKCPPLGLLSSRQLRYMLLGLLALSGQGVFAQDSTSKLAATAADQNSIARSLDDEPIDPRTWRMLEMTMVAQDNLKVEITLLRPLWWIEKAGARAGHPLYLDLKEMALAGPTTVHSIGKLPFEDIRGAGTVTAIYRHPASNLMDLQLEGESRPIRVTVSHPFRLVETDAWVRAGDLKPGQEVVTRAGFTKVLSVAPVEGSEDVHNLEVHGTHTYLVGLVGGGIWVHNACIAPDKIVDKFKDPKTGDTLPNIPKTHATPDEIADHMNGVIEKAKPKLDHFGNEREPAIFPPAGINFKVPTKAEALAAVKKFMPKDAVEMPDAVPPVYDPPPPGKSWFRAEPVEPGTNELPHVKYEILDFGNKNGKGKIHGHIFYDG